MLRTTWIFLLIVCSVAMDVSFIPNDENAPLPLSTKYRDSLRKLCDLLRESANNLPAEMQTKKHVLNKMCKKLQADDNNISSAGGTLVNQNMGKVLVAILAVGGGYYAWQNKDWISLTIASLLGRGSKGKRIGTDTTKRESVTPEVVGAADRAKETSIGLDADHQKRLSEAREARLKRFSEMNQKIDPSSN